MGGWPGVVVLTWTAYPLGEGGTTGWCGIMLSLHCHYSFHGKFKLSCTKPLIAFPFSCLCPYLVSVTWIFPSCFSDSWVTGLHKSRSKCIWHPHINNGLSLFTAAVVPEMMIYQWFSCGFVSLIVAMLLQCTTPWPASSFPNTTGCYERVTSVLCPSQQKFQESGYFLSGI